MDPITDCSARVGLEAIDSAFDIPEFVLHAPLADTKLAAALPQELFADPTRQQFPVDTAANVWLSAAYLSLDDTKTAAERGYIGERIKQAAAILGVSELPAVEKVAAAPTVAPVTEYCLVQEDGTTMYPVFDKHSADLAVTRFRENGHLYPQGTRYQLAQGVLKQAERMGATIPVSVYVEAGEGLPIGNDKIATVLRNSMSRVEDPELLKGGQDLIDLVEDPDTDAAIAVAAIPKIAEAIDRMDHYTGRCHYYGVTAVTPMTSLHYLDITAKQAEALTEDVVNIGGEMFDVQKLAALGAEPWSILGDCFVESISDDEGVTVSPTKLADVLPTLPVEDQALMLSSLRS